jgi:hypothetical protein
MCYKVPDPVGSEPFWQYPDRSHGGKLRKLDVFISASGGQATTLTNLPALGSMEGDSGHA